MSIFKQAQAFYFYPRSPCGERPWARGSRVTYVEFLSTLSLRRATYQDKFSIPSDNISIHALLAESDLFRQNYECFKWIFLSTLSLRRATQSSAKSTPEEAISIHALLAESDKPRSIQGLALPVFLSTLSLRRATHGQKTKGHRSVFLSTLSLRRATAKKYSGLSFARISIHALLAESDTRTQSASLSL